MKHPTIKDLAHALDLSIATVSRAFREEAEISARTRQRVLEMAEKMGYQPHPGARGLSSSRTYQIGVVIPELLQDFFPRVIQGLQHVLEPAGYQLLIMQSEESPEKEHKQVAHLIQNRVEGLLVSVTENSQSAAYYQQLHDRGMPLVFFNRSISQVQAPRVVFNDHKWAYFATEHLIQQGCKRLLHLAGSQQIGLCRARAQGFLAAVQKYGFHESAYRVVETGLNLEAGTQTLGELLAAGEHFDGIFAVNDPVALGALQILQAAGVSIPEQVAVMGFSDAMWAPWVTPSLSSVKQPAYEMGKAAAQLLLRHIKDASASAEIKVLEGELILRDSSLRGAS